MSGRYSVKPKADQDLDEYADYLTQEATIDVALRFFAEAHETFLVDRRPSKHRMARTVEASAAPITPSFSRERIERMLILYRTLTAGVDILRVVHGSRNLQALFRRRAEIE